MFLYTKLYVHIHLGPCICTYKLENPIYRVYIASLLLTSIHAFDARIDGESSTASTDATTIKRQWSSKHAPSTCTVQYKHANAREWLVYGA